MAQTALDDIINSPRRGSWDDQFDAKASRTATAVVSNNPIFGPGSAGYIQQAILDYQNIVSSGGWPEVSTAQKLKIGMSDPAVQQLRQRLIISGDLPRAVVAWLAICAKPDVLRLPEVQIGHRVDHRIVDFSPFPGRGMGKRAVPQ